jgi:hypothetical protein
MFPTTPLPYFASFSYLFKAATDGRYLYSYIIVNVFGPNSFSGLYRTNLIDFFSLAGHQIFNISALSVPPLNSSPSIRGPPFSDGTWLYFYGERYISRVLIGSDFSQASSWNVLDLATLYAREALGYLVYIFPSGFDGRYVYYSQECREQNSLMTLKYDTYGSFSDPAAWQWFSKQWSVKYLPPTNPVNISYNTSSITDSGGNTFVTVIKTDSTPYVIVQANNQPVATVSNGYASRITIKYDKNGNYLWYIFTSSEGTIGSVLRVDSKGYLYMLGLGVQGVTQSNGSYFSNRVGGGSRYQAQIIQIDQNGLGVWEMSTEQYPFTRNSTVQFYDITFDGAGNAYAVGSFNAEGFQGANFNTTIVIHTQTTTSTTPYCVMTVKSARGFGVIMKLGSIYNTTAQGGATIQFVNFTFNSPVYPVSVRYASGAVYVAGSYQSTTLQWYNTTSAVYTFNASTYSSSLQRFVIVPNGQVFLYVSNDNPQGQPAVCLSTTSPLSANFLTVVWSPSLSLFVTLTTGYGLYSSDGVTWTQMSSAPSGTFVSSCVTSLGVFFLNSASPTSYYSATGTSSWTAVSLPVGTWNSVASNGSSTLVVVGSSTQIVAVSTDGCATWAGYSVLPSSLTLSSVVWSPTLSLWIAVGPGSTGVYSSSPSTSWSTSTLPATKWNALSAKLTASLVVAVGNGSNVAWTSDGFTWNTPSVPVVSNWVTVSYSPDINYFLAISGTTYHTIYSQDGVTWTFGFTPTRYTTLSNPLSQTTTTDGFLEVFTPSGSISSAKVITKTTPTNYFWPSGLYVDSSGNIYICTNSRTGLLGSSTQIYLLKYSPSLNLLWTVSVIGSSGDQWTPYMVADSSGNLIFTFSVYSTLLTVTDALGRVTTYTKEPPQFIYDTYRDTLILKFSPAGALLSQITITGALDEFPSGIGIDSLNNLYWYGFYLSSDIQVINADGSQTGSITFPTTGLLVGEAQGGSYTLLLKFNSSGTALWGASGIVTGNDSFPTSAGTQMTIPITLQNGYRFYQGSRYFYLFSIGGEGGLTPSIVRYDPFSAPTANFISSMVVEYAHLSEDEVKYFRNTIQYTPFEHIQSTFVTLAPGTTQIVLPFINLVKDLYVTSNTLTNIKLTFHGEDLFNFSGDYFGKLIPYETEVNMPSNTPTYKYTFGAPVNFSRIDSKVLTITQGSTAGFWIYAKTVNVLGVGNGVAGLLFISRQYVV